MIKEKKKGKYQERSLKEELIGYIKTAGIAFIIAIIVTLLLSFHARSEMIKNLYVNKYDREKLDAKIAQKIIEQSDLTEALNDKSYALCMQIGNIYESAGDYAKAEYAYTIALKKVPSYTYAPYYKLTAVLITQEKFSEAQKIIDSVFDTKNVKIIKFKTRAYIIMGDKYNSINKYLKAADCYEKANYYYSKFTKKDKYIDESIKKRLAQAYIDVADVIVKNGYNSDAIRFLKKAQVYNPNNYIIKYKLAIIYADLNPVLSVDYFEPLLEKIPQQIDFDVYNRALMKAANIADLEGDGIRAKYYRYRVHTIDLFLSQKVVYKDDVDVILKSFDIKKFFFKYKLKAKFKIVNNSHLDIRKLYAEFVLKQNDKVKESYIVECASKKQPLFSNGGESQEIPIEFGKNIYTKRELNNYHVEIYLYKDDKYKTLLSSFKVPTKGQFKK